MKLKVKVKFQRLSSGKNLAGKTAEFEVKINEVLIAELQKLTMNLLKKNFGPIKIKKLIALKETSRRQLWSHVVRDLFKQELFDFLNKKYDFDLPSGLVEDQLKAMWQEVEEGIKINPENLKTIKRKKRKIKARSRCANGSLWHYFIWLGSKNKIEITNDDINKELGKIITEISGHKKTGYRILSKTKALISNWLCSFRR